MCLPHVQLFFVCAAQHFQQPFAGQGVCGSQHRVCGQQPLSLIYMYQCPSRAQLLCMNMAPVVKRRPAVSRGVSRLESVARGVGSPAELKPCCCREVRRNSQY